MNLLPVFNYMLAFLSKTKDATYCKISECCNTDYIKNDIAGLRIDLNRYVYGQHLVEDTVIPALEDHLGHLTPKKPLTLSFHGWPGSGKNYVTKFIVDNLYKKGSDSKFVHNYMGQIHFPEAQNVPTYKMNLFNEIKDNIEDCPQQVFIFDEVDKIPAGVFDVLKPIFDTHDNIDKIDFRRSIFIFLSNTGGTLVTNELKNLDHKGYLREQLTLHDFEPLIKRGAFNEKGGFQFSDTIESNLIDHYIPFLPLEQKHVKLCIHDEFNRRKVQASSKDIDEILEYVTYDDNNNGKYSTTGCKRISQKVATTIRRKNYRNKNAGEL